jgi:hypothetical protein
MAMRLQADRRNLVAVTETTRDDAERKQVTVLFADVSGSMDLAEQQDPEEWRKIMQRFFAILADAVTELEGTVDKFTGDGIMAVFGAPVAHEDHAARACYAALQMLDDVAEYAGELRRANGLNFSTTSPATRPSCGGRRASTSRSGSGSTPVRSWQGRSAGAMATTRQSATRSDWRSGWRHWPSPARRT